MNDELRGLRILVPRGGAAGARIARLVRQRGGDPVIAPLTVTAPAPDAAALGAAVARLADGHYDWLVLTSATGAEVLAQQLDAAGSSLPAATRVAAVGPATAAALAERGIAVHLVPEHDFSAAGLADALARRLDPGPDEACATPSERVPLRFLLPLSELADSGLERALAAAGHAVDRVTSYRTVAAPEDPALAARLAAGGIDAVLVLSASGAAETARRLAAPSSPAPAMAPGFLLAAIGPPTARALAAHGLPATITATRHTVPGLLDAIAAHVAIPHLDPTRRHPESESSRMFPVHRPRRLRASAAMRRLTAETRLHPAELILPLFVREGIAEPHPIGSMPGVQQHTIDSLRRISVQAAEAGLGGVMLFGVPAERDASGSAADDPEGILNAATRAVAAEVGDALVVQTDLCLDEFTDHGHCGVLSLEAGAGAGVDNDATLRRYCSMALAQAEAGSAMLGLSGMMDGQVAAVRRALDAAGRHDVALLAYSAKYASAFYGPFREAVDSQLGTYPSVPGDRRGYQQDPANRREGRREAQLDIDEGADAVMVKPAMSYLDVLADVAATSPVPVWAYQVSGEAAMIEAAAANRWIDRRRAIEESVLGIRRAGADAVLSYFALELAEWLR